MKISKGAIYLLLAALLYSIMPVLIRFLGAGHIPPISQVFLRYVVAFSCAQIYFVFSKSQFHFDRKSLPLLMAIAIFGYALTNLFFTYSILLTQIGSALFIFYCFSIITPILGFFVVKEKINRFNIVAFILTFLALMLLFRPNSVATWQIGGVFAFLSALGQSIFLIGRKKLPQYSSKLILLVSTFSGAIVVGLLALTLENNFYFQGGITTLAPKTWLITFLFGLGNFSAWLLMSKGFATVKSSLGSLLLLCEVVIAPVLALVVFGEIPTIYTILGGLLILTSAVLVAVKGDNS